MIQLNKKVVWVGLISSYALVSSGVLALAHSGHKHEEKLRVSLPGVVAKVNGEDIRSDDIHVN